MRGLNRYGLLGWGVTFRNRMGWCRARFRDVVFHGTKGLLLQRSASIVFRKAL